ncbi:MAG: helix-turn-helix transcriptional regulator [Solirubrobacterales bacterium]|nr:helix-turn-helix transcriptional regulator [Solirubrobacterales bacterium]
MGVREERRAAAREGILAAAHRQLAEGGLASASMTTVAARAGVATGSLYRHFPSRDELLAAVVGDALRGEQALLERAVEGARSPSAGLEAWVRTALERAFQAPHLHRALFHEPAGPPVEVVREEAAQMRAVALAGLLADGATEGAWPAGPMALQATAMLGALNATTAGGPGSDGDSAGRVAAELVTFLRTGLDDRAG